jgi:hypothetical protein
MRTGDAGHHHQPAGSETFTCRIALGAAIEDVETALVTVVALSRRVAQGLHRLVAPDAPRLQIVHALLHDAVHAALPHPIARDLPLAVPGALHPLAQNTTAAGTRPGRQAQIAEGYLSLDQSLLEKKQAHQRPGCRDPVPELHHVVAAASDLAQAVHGL